MDAATGARVKSTLPALSIPTRGADAGADGAVPLGVISVAGKTLSGIGPHAVSAGTSSNAANVTSQTRCRAPADARCIVSVIPSATSRMSVAFRSSISMETLEPVMPLRAVSKVDIIGLSPALTCATDGVAEPLDLGVADIDV